MVKKILIVLSIIAICGIGWFVIANNTKDNNNTAKQTTTERQQLFDKTRFSLDDPASLWVIANKQRPLNPKDYEPANLVAPDIPLRLTAKDEEMLLRRDAADALKELATEAKKGANLHIMLASAYRSYEFQKNLYNRYVGLQGQATADQQSARAGFSEHQTGLAADIEPASRKCEVETCFGDLPEGKWVAKNAWRYGFVIRYPEDKTKITGYTYEPWHLRYVGKDLAQAVHDAGDPTLEEFFNLKPAPDYK